VAGAGATGDDSGGSDEMHGHVAEGIILPQSLMLRWVDSCATPSTRLDPTNYHLTPYK